MMIKGGSNKIINFLTKNLRIRLSTLTYETKAK